MVVLLLGLWLLLGCDNNPHCISYQTVYSDFGQTDIIHVQFHQKISEVLILAVTKQNSIELLLILHSNCNDYFLEKLCTVYL